LWGDLPLDLMEYTDFSFKALIFVAVYQGALYYNDMYMGRLFGTWELCARVGISSAAAVVLLAIFYFVFPETLIGRGVFAISILLSFAVILTGRLLLSRFLMYGKFSQRILILGSGERAREVAELIRGREHLGYKLVGFIGHNETLVDPGNGDAAKHGKAGSAADLLMFKGRLKESVAEAPTMFVAADYYFERAKLPSEVVSNKPIRSGKGHNYS